MNLEFFQTTNAPAAIGPYSQAVGLAGIVFVSGQLGVAPATGLLHESFDAQAKQALENMFAILTEAGLTAANVVSVDVYVTDLGQFQRFNAIYAECFADHKPARAVIGVSALPLGGQVEIRCIAGRTKP